MLPGKVTVGPLAMPPVYLVLQRRRSYNCGSGDLIVQPLATAENIR